MIFPTASFIEAKEYRDKFRPVLPAVYNSAVLQNQPAPLLPKCNDEETDDTAENYVLPPVQLDDSDNLAIEAILDTSTIPLADEENIENDVNSQQKINAITNDSEESNLE